MEEKKVETISPPSTSSSSKIVAKEIASIGKTICSYNFDFSFELNIEKNMIIFTGEFIISFYILS